MLPILPKALCHGYVVMLPYRQVCWQQDKIKPPYLILCYRYLAESIRMMPDQEALATMFREADLERVTYRNLSGGIVAIHSGWRL